MRCLPNALKLCVFLQPRSRCYRSDVDQTNLQIDLMLCVKKSNIMPRPCAGTYLMCLVCTGSGCFQHGNKLLHSADSAVNQGLHQHVVHKAYETTQHACLFHHPLVCPEQAPVDHSHISGVTVCTQAVCVQTLVVCHTHIKACHLDHMLACSPFDDAGSCLIQVCTANCDINM